MKRLLLGLTFFLPLAAIEAPAAKEKIVLPEMVKNMVNFINEILEFSDRLPKDAQRDFSKKFSYDDALHIVDTNVTLLQKNKDCFTPAYFSIANTVLEKYRGDLKLEQKAQQPCPPCSITGPTADFCNVIVQNDLCVGNNVNIQGDLSVCGSIITVQSFTFAYDADTQTIASANNFQDVKFSNNGQLAGWAHTANTALFTCQQPGIYLIEYDAICRKLAGGLETFSAAATLNGTEISGSQGAIQQANNNQPLSISRSFIVQCANNDQLIIRCAGSSTLVQLVANTGVSDTVAATRPSITLTITRIG